MTDKEDEGEDGTSDLTSGEAAVFDNRHGNHHSDGPSSNSRPSGKKDGYDVDIVCRPIGLLFFLQ